MKSARNDYSEKPFYYTEIFEGSPRTLAWHESTDSQKAIFFGLLELLNDRIEYLFKEDTGEKDGYEKWVRISGGIYKSDLIELLHKHEDWFFGDSVFQFCFREPEGQSYVAYDEHGGGPHRSDSLGARLSYKSTDYYSGTHSPLN